MPDGQPAGVEHVDWVDHYEVLGVSPDHSHHEISLVYRALVLGLHPQRISTPKVIYGIRLLWIKKPGRNLYRPKERPNVGGDVQNILDSNSNNITDPEKLTVSNSELFTVHRDNIGEKGERKNSFG